MDGSTNGLSTHLKIFNYSFDKNAFSYVNDLSINAVNYYQCSLKKIKFFKVASNKFNQTIICLPLHMKDAEIVLDIYTLSIYFKTNDTSHIIILAR